MAFCSYEAVIKLLEEVEKHQILWNHRLKDYSKNRSLKEKIWQDIGQRLHMSGEDTKHRWENIRESFTRKRRKALKSGQSPCESSWPVMPYLEFLSVVVTTRTMSFIVLSYFYL